MARLPYVDRATAPAAVREVLERLPVDLKIFRMMAHAETNFRPLVRLGASILAEQQLSPKLRELAILRVARLSPAEYEWVQHVPIAKATGVSDEQIDALARGDVAAACFDPVERLVLRFTSELCAGVRATEATVDEAIRHFSAREIVELILVVGYYMMLARLMETTRIDLDAPAGTRVVDAIR